MNKRLTRREFLKTLSLLSAGSLLLSQKSPFQSLNQGAEKPNIILILFDTLSASNLSLYGYPRNTTPNLSRFAERATFYHSHYSAGNFTTPGVASLLTGTYPWTHRAFNLNSTVKKEIVDQNLFALLGSSYFRFAFSQSYLTNIILAQFDQYIESKLDEGAFSKIHPPFHGITIKKGDSIESQTCDFFLFPASNMPNSYIPGSFYFSFLRRKWLDPIINNVVREYLDSFPRGIPNHPGRDEFFLLESVIDSAVNSLRSLPSPSLVYLHFFPPHESFTLNEFTSQASYYTPRRDYIGIFNDDLKLEKKKEHFFSDGVPFETLYQYRREYDEYIAYTDAQFGRLYDFLDQAGFLDNSYVVVTSDHGQLFERGVHMHNTPLLYEPIVRIPLLISAPGQRERKDVSIPTSSTDVIPTLLHLSGREIPDGCEGSLLPALGGTDSTSRIIYAMEAKMSFKYRPFSTATFMMLQDRYKLIYYLGYPGFENQFELYDLQNDPEEMEDLFQAKPEIARAMRNILEEKIKEVDSPYLKKP